MLNLKPKTSSLDDRLRAVALSYQATSRSSSCFERERRILRLVKDQTLLEQELRTVFADLLVDALALHPTSRNQAEGYYCFSHRLGGSVRLQRLAVRIQRMGMHTAETYWVISVAAGRHVRATANDAQEKLLYEIALRRFCLFGDGPLAA